MKMWIVGLLFGLGLLVSGCGVTCSPGMTNVNGSCVSSYPTGMYGYGQQYPGYVPGQVPGQYMPGQIPGQYPYYGAPGQIPGQYPYAH